MSVSVLYNKNLTETNLKPSFSQSVARTYLYAITSFSPSLDGSCQLEGVPGVSLHRFFPRINICTLSEYVIITHIHHIFTYNVNIIFVFDLEQLDSYIQP